MEEINFNGLSLFSFLWQISKSFSNNNEMYSKVQYVGLSRMGWQKFNIIFEITF